MPHAIEIAHFAEMLAGLIVTASRPDLTVEHRQEIHGALVETISDALTMLSHDALGIGDPPPAGDLVAVLEAAIAREKNGASAAVSA